MFDSPLLPSFVSRDEYLLVGSSDPAWPFTLTSLWSASQYWMHCSSLQVTYHALTHGSITRETTSRTPSSRKRRFSPRGYDIALEGWKHRLVELNLCITIENARELCIRDLFRRVYALDSNLSTCTPLNLCWHR